MRNQASRTVRPWVVLGVLLAAWLVAAVGTAQPAHAHGRGSDATNLHSVITEAPDLPGVSWRVHGGDHLLEVRNDGGAELLVYGYANPPEPFVIVGPDGVFENRRSPAVYLSDDRYGQTELPVQADPAADPDWVQVSGGASHAWHDHRVHYMAPGLPPAVTDPRERTLVIERWEVPIQHDGQEYVLAGQLWWEPGPPVWPWLALGLVLTLPALAGLRTPPSPDGGWTRVVRPAAAVLALLAIANLTHVVDDLWALPLPLGTRIFDAGVSLLFVVIAGFGAVRAWQAGPGAFTALGVGASAALVGHGLLYLPVLGASQLATLFGEHTVRVLVGASIAQAVPLGIVTLVGTQRALRAHPGDPDPEGARGEGGDLGAPHASSPPEGAPRT